MKNENVRLCAHYKTNGQQCEAIALTDDRFCYFHSRDRQRVALLRRAHAARCERVASGFTPHEVFPQNAHTDDLYDDTSATLLDALDLPVLEDGTAIQITVTNVIRMLALQQISHRSAALMLYGLQIASGP